MTENIFTTDDARILATIFGEMAGLTVVPVGSPEASPKAPDPVPVPDAPKDDPSPETSAEGGVVFVRYTQPPIRGRKSWARVIRASAKTVGWLKRRNKDAPEGHAATRPLGGEFLSRDVETPLDHGSLILTATTDRSGVVSWSLKHATVDGSSVEDLPTLSFGADLYGDKDGFDRLCQGILNHL